MMFNYPYFGFPNYRRYYNYNPNFYKNPFNSSNTHTKNFKNLQKDSNTTASKKLDNDENNKNKEQAMFDLFGLKLYFDDILIIALLFFLYNEGVKDYGLFICLIMLLLS